MTAFIAIVLFAAWAVQGVGRPADARMRALSLARRQGDGLASISFQQRIVAPLIESVGRWVAAFLPGAFEARTEARLVLAGQPFRPTSFYALMLAMGAVLSGAYLLLVFAASDGFPSILALMPAVFLGVVGMYLVAFWLSAQAKSRQGAMLRALPDSMDLLTICVEAGLGLDAAFHRVTEKQTGPLVDEIRVMLRELGLGKARRDALRDLADRTQIDDVRTFVNAVSQAEQLGTSLAPVLRAQSQRLRVRRRQRAEQEARRVPVKMVFPLVFCLMPSLFIFILGPIVVNLYNYVSRS
jgi:tight adherence protein C